MPHLHRGFARKAAMKYDFFVILDHKSVAIKQRSECLQKSKLGEPEILQESRGFRQLLKQPTSIIINIVIA